jgi:hypothetical protein
MTAPFLSRWDPQGAASARENSPAAARVLDSNFKQPRTIRCRAVIPIEIVIAGLDPVIHPLRRKLLRRGMDARIKSGHDERVWRNWQLLRADSDFISATALFADTTSRSRDAKRPSRCIYLSPPRNGGRGECRVPAAPAASCALCSGRSARVTTSTPESPGIPARNGFNGVCRALPGDRALLPPSSCEYGMSAPGRADMPPQNLTPASVRQNHTIWPSAGSISRPRA